MFIASELRTLFSRPPRVFVPLPADVPAALFGARRGQNPEHAADEVGRSRAPRGAGQGAGGLGSTHDAPRVQGLGRRVFRGEGPQSVEDLGFTVVRVQGLRVPRA